MIPGDGGDQILLPDVRCHLCKPNPLALATLACSCLNVVTAGKTKNDNPVYATFDLIPFPMAFSTCGGDDLTSLHVPAEDLGEIRVATEEGNLVADDTGKLATSRRGRMGDCGGNLHYRATARSDMQVGSASWNTGKGAPECVPCGQLIQSDHMRRGLASNDRSKL